MLMRKRYNPKLSELDALYMDQKDPDYFGYKRSISAQKAMWKGCYPISYWRDCCRKDLNTMIEKMNPGVSDLTKTLNKNELLDAILIVDSIHCVSKYAYKCPYYKVSSHQVKELDQKKVDAIIKKREKKSSQTEKSDNSENQQALVLFGESEKSAYDLSYFYRYAFGMIKGDYFYYGLNCKGPRKRVAGKHFFVLKEWNTEEASDVTNKINNGMSLKELAFQCLDSRDSNIDQYLNEHTNVEHVFIFEGFKKSKPILIWDGSVQYVSNYIKGLEYMLVSVNRKDENSVAFIINEGKH